MFVNPEVASMSSRHRRLGVHQRDGHVCSSLAGVEEQQRAVGHECVRRCLQSEERLRLRSEPEEEGEDVLYVVEESGAQHHIEPVQSDELLGEDVHLHELEAIGVDVLAKTFTGTEVQTDDPRRAPAHGLDAVLTFPAADVEEGLALHALRQSEALPLVPVGHAFALHKAPGPPAWLSGTR